MLEGIGYGRRRLIQEIIKQNWDEEKKQFNYNELLYVIQEMLQEEGKPYFENRAETRGLKIFKAFIEHLLYRNLANYDSMVLVTAEKGTGKSSAAIMMAKQWCRLLGINFDPKRHIAYNNADVMQKIDLLKPFEPLICDEAVRFATAAEWAKKENKELLKKLAQVRTKHLFYILCFPLKIQKINKVYLESNVNYWVDLFGRGIGGIYVRDRNPTQDSWRVKDFDKVGSYNEFTPINKVRDALKKHPNFWQVIRFPKPPRWLYDRYLKVREKNVYDDENILKSVCREDIYRALLVLSLRDIMMQDDTLSMNRIILHVKNEYDVNMAKGMINVIIEDAKQLVAKVRDQSIEA